MAQDAIPHNSASVDTPLSRSTGPNGSSDMSYVSTASVDSGPDEMAEIPELGKTTFRLSHLRQVVRSQTMLEYGRSYSHVTEGNSLHIVQQVLLEPFLEHCIISVCPQRHFARCTRKHETGAAA